MNIFMVLYRRRRYVRRRKVARKSRVSKPRMGSFGRMAKLGFMKITRKTQQFSMYNGVTTGVVNISGTWPGAGPIALGTPTASTTGLTGYYDIPGAMSVSLNQLLSYTELTTLFDKYKINWIRLRIFSGGNTASLNGKGLLPSLVWCVDEDDAIVTGLTVDSIREKMGSKERQFPQNGKPISIFIRPKIAVADAWGGSQTTINGLSVKKADYVNSQYPSLPHYGLKFAFRDVLLDTVTNGVYTNFRFDLALNVSLKDVQ